MDIDHASSQIWQDFYLPEPLADNEIRVRQSFRGRFALMIEKKQRY